MSVIGVGFFYDFGLSFEKNIAVLRAGVVLDFVTT